MGIILAGGGSPSQSLSVDLYFRELLEGRGVAFVPHAMTSPNIWSSEKAAEWFKNRDAMKDISVNVVEELPDLATLSGNSEAIFLMGGNTFHLLKQCQDAEVLPTLKAMADSGSHLIYGCSAGAILMGHSIVSASLGSETDENDLDLVELEALDVLAGCNVFVHYTKADYDEVVAMTEQEACPTICISEEGGVYWDNGELTNIGSDPVTIFYPSKVTLSVPRRGTVQLTG